MEAFESEICGKALFLKGLMNIYQGKKKHRKRF